MQPTEGPDHAWLPDHQLHVVATLAHAEELLSLMAGVLYDYVAPPGPLALETVAAGDQAHVTVAAVAPMPAAISRYAAAALTQLRGAVEHVQYSEVENLLGRELSEAEGRLLEMPPARVSSRSWHSTRPAPREAPEAVDRVAR